MQRVIMTYNINHANIKEWAANYQGELFDGILCDPPYELGFMGKSWDSSGIAFDQEMWADILKLLKPGGHLLAFSGSRTYHRMAVAIEDAGFEIRDMIEWVYGSGFPKSLNIGKAVDKIQGNEREVTGVDNKTPKFGAKGDRPNVAVEGGTYGGKIERTKGNSPYEGYGTALKPAHEPCVLARKPIEGTVANNVLKHGTGGLNIDGSRVVHRSEADKLSATPQGRVIRNNFAPGEGIDGTETNRPDTSLGRFPANLIHDGSDEVEAVFPTSNSSATKRNRNTIGSFGMPNDNTPEYGDKGSASRFFYTAKASKSERNAGLEGFEPKREADRVRDDGVGGDNPRNRTNNAKANHHPTVKPLSLTKYLATLIKPPTSGRLLVPFSGSGSEMIGALQAGWEYVEGVELTEEYIPIAEARIKHWLYKMSKEQLEML
jgi:site-specific DNA-methyltransferase (adenine-specific)